MNERALFPPVASMITFLAGGIALVSRVVGVGVAVGADTRLQGVEAVGLEEAAEDAVEGAGVQVDEPGVEIVAGTEIALALRCCRAPRAC